MKRWLVAAWIGALLIAPAARAAEKKPPEDKRSVAELVQALGGELPGGRQRAASALGKMGTLPVPAARALARSVTDPDPWVRESAIDALRRGTKDESILLPVAAAARRLLKRGENVLAVHCRRGERSPAPVDVGLEGAGP